jgi:glutamate dehydrogenase (NAD(P)+)
MRAPVRVVVSGYGDVGETVVRLLGLDDRFSVVGVGDITGGRYAAAGVAGEQLEDALSEGAQLGSAPLGEHVGVSELLELPCDVLVPAAVGGVIGPGNASAIQANLIVEGANAPTTPQADEILADRGVVVVPDILANAGGVVGSWLEWTQAFGGGWLDQRFEQVIASKLQSAFARTAAASSARGLSLRDAALALGVRTVADAHLARGLYP